jgi:hypothetical protein
VWLGHPAVLLSMLLVGNSAGYICEATGGFPYATEAELQAYNAAVVPEKRITLADARTRGIVPQMVNGLPKVCVILPCAKAFPLRRTLPRGTGAHGQVQDE